ncbi:DNA recombination protein RmuC [Aureimonas fodinaquatilis]|uniref:DNA recombination protein RmuC homolog n=1 Tax=Aureimonas fodinaquatilis TaxID=2565783 RepID=A0A5B0E4J8_9HYPH|nr:DNA recombination protein RmuC [Aureimonas fodinaquatilis]KAA0972349.1 DNA recombination protein RmuC [Aureimonas fodinaquatilis]
MTVESLINLWQTPLFNLAGQGISLGVLGSAAMGCLLVFAVLRLRRERADAEDAALRFEAILQSQAELTGRMQTMGEILGGRQADLARLVAERLDGVGVRVNQSIAESSGKTQESLSKLAERLAVIDRAQGEIRNLAGEVVRLQDILANKQARGAFGQGRMEAIIADALPSGSYSFQATLSNGKRPDCLIHMPNGAPALAIDAKFPLEGFSALRAAEEPEARQAAGQRFRRDMDVHIRAVSEKYLISGETQDTAFLFVPSEAVFAELYEHFDDIVQKAHRARVVIVSPSLLLLSVQVVQALLKDHLMRQEAGRIQHEVGLLSQDLQRLDQRVQALKTHFGQTGRDIDLILTSTGKLLKRGERIAAVDLDTPESAPMPGRNGPELRVVDGE